MAESSYDCVVIGSGPGGYVAAIRAAQLGCKTAVVERDEVGGRCLNYACIPAKAVLRSADLLSEIRDAEEFGLRVSGVEVDYGAIQARRGKVVSTLTCGVAGLFKKNGIELIEGERAALAGTAGGRCASASERARRAKTSILATGSVKRSIPGRRVRRAGDRHRGGVGARRAAGDAWRSSAPAPRAPRSPRPMRGWAARCVLLEALERVLPTEDADISRLVERGLKRQGDRGRTRAAPSRTSSDRGSSVSFSHGDAARRGRLARDRRRARARRRGARTRTRPAWSSTSDGLDQGRRGAADHRATGVYAIGDLVPGPALAHKASDEGIIAVEDAAGRPTHPLAYIDIPRATFCTPNVGSASG